MNLATSSLIIFLIVSPAILARRLYFTKELSRNYVSRNTLQEIFSAIFLSFILHFIWVWVCGYDTIDFKTTFQIILNPNSVKDYRPITDHVNSIALYFLSLAIVSAAGGWILKIIIRASRRDRKWSWFTYDNKWAYIFSGDVLDMSQYNKNPEVSSKDANIKLVDVSVKSGDQLIYSGVLIDHQLNDNNSVDYIVLSKPVIIEKWREEDTATKKISFLEKRKKIDSNFFIIPYSDILNLNIRYAKDITEEEAMPEGTTTKTEDKAALDQTEA